MVLNRYDITNGHNTTSKLFPKLIIALINPVTLYEMLYEYKEMSMRPHYKGL